MRVVIQVDTHFVLAVDRNLCLFDQNFYDLCMILLGCLMKSIRTILLMEYTDTQAKHMARVSKSHPPLSRQTVPV